MLPRGDVLAGIREAGRRGQTNQDALLLPHGRRRRVGISVVSAVKMSRLIRLCSPTVPGSGPVSPEADTNHLATTSCHSSCR